MRSRWPISTRVWICNVISKRVLAEQDWDVRRLLTSVVVFTACIAPLVALMFGAMAGRLGVNPAEMVIRSLGEWALRFLLLTLAATPLARWFHVGLLLCYRRMVGLFSFGYGLLHLIAYVWLDHFFVWSDLLEDILQRPFIVVGITTLVLLIPLAITSLARVRAAMGIRAWKRLHWLVYVAAVLALVHYFMLVKADLTGPVLYTLAFALLIGARLPLKRR